MTALAPSRVVLTVGNAMMGDDGAGPKLYDMMTNSPFPAGRPLTAAARRKTSLTESKRSALIRW